MPDLASRPPPDDPTPLPPNPPDAWVMKHWQRLNPPFDRRMRSIGAPHAHNRRLERGWIASNNDFPGTQGQTKGLIRFLYNPTELATSFNMNMTIPANDQVPDYILEEVGTAATNVLAAFGTTSLNLLFDRTYEVWEGSDKVERGVFDDLAAFYRLLGIIQEDETFPTHPMGVTNVWVYLGRTKTNKTGGGSVRYQGIVDSLTTKITHWAWDMTPIRAAVSLNLTLYPLAATELLDDDWFRDPQTWWDQLEDGPPLETGPFANVPEDGPPPLETGPFAPNDD